MRLILQFIPPKFVSVKKINKHAIQGMIYNHLKNTTFKNYHNGRYFKFFSFSDIFPINEDAKIKHLIISSPNENLIITLYNSFRNEDYFEINGSKFQITDLKKFILKVTNKFISGSPIVLYKNNKKNEYFSFKKEKNLDFFLERLRENALKKFYFYSGKKLEFNENLFDRLIFKKEVVIKDIKMGNEFILIGSVWGLLEKFNIKDEYKELYEFIMDCGLGEKNSLGYGFINPVK